MKPIILFLCLILTSITFVSRCPANAKANATANSTLALPDVRSIDIMKYSKDVVTGQPSDAELENLVSTLAQAHVNYIAISVPMDASSDYPQNFKPAPRDAYAFTQKLADTIHAQGLGVIWRGTWSGIEGIYGFPKLVGSARFPAGTAASAAADGRTTWLGKTYQYIVANPNFFKVGDIWAPLPERTEGIFSDSTAFLPNTGAGIQANYAQFSVDLKTVSDRAFAAINKQVYTGMSANNYSEVKSTWLPQQVFDTAGVIAIDYYGANHSPAEMDQDLRAMYALRRKPIFLEEWGDYWNSGLPDAARQEYLQSIFQVLNQLRSENILVGFNYWGGWDNQAEGLLTRDQSGFHLNFRGELLASYFSGATAGQAATPPAPAAPITAPTPSAVPLPASAKNQSVVLPTAAPPPSAALQIQTKPVQAKQTVFQIGCSN